MPPPRKDHAERRVHDVLECASKTLVILRDKTPIPEALMHAIETHVQHTLPLTHTPLLVEKASTFDSLGTDLWNQSAQIVHDDDFPCDPKTIAGKKFHVGVLVRVFALLLLDTAHRSSAQRSKDPDRKVRIFKVALRTSRLCLNRNALELSIKALEMCARNVAISSEPQPLLRIAEPVNVNETEEEVNLKILTAEYYLLRLMHAWKSNRLDLADHFLAKYDTLKITNATELTIKEADLFDEIAKSLAKDKQLQDATKWSERAFLALGKCDDEATTQEAAELKLYIGVSLVEQLLADGQPSSRSRAWKVVNALEKTHGLQNRVTLEIIKFQVMAAGDNVDADQIHQALLRMVNMTVLTEESFKTIMRTMRQAVEVSAPPTLAALKIFICNRLLPELQSSPTEDTAVETWLEKATITYILLATSPSTDKAVRIDIPAVSQLLDEISNMNEIQFSAKATHAAQTLLWKAAGNFGTWSSCKLLQHPLFFNAGHLNKARIGRKLMRHALDNEDLPAAREAFFQMSKDVREESLTQFLAFRLALKSQDEDLAAECLRNVARHAFKDPTHLYACVIEAQKSPMRHVAVMALQAVLGQRPPGIYLACLLRCTVRLLIAELDTAANEEARNQVAHEVLQIFETASKSVEVFREASIDNWRTEVQWWSKNAYNLSIRLCGAIDPEYTVRFLSACSTLLDYHHPKDGTVQQQTELENRKLLCAFLSTTALIVLGRSSPKEDAALQYYLSAQTQIQTFQTLYASLRPKLHDPAAATSASNRHFAILKFHLECLLKLSQFQDLAPVLQACLDASPSGGTEEDAAGKWNTLADLLILLHQNLKDPSSPSSGLITSLLQKAINATYQSRSKNSSSSSLQQVARWIRYTFTLFLSSPQRSDGDDKTSSQPSSSDFSLNLLQQAAQIAQKGYDDVSGEKYPEAELQWLAIMGFNHAVDLFALMKGCGGGGGEEQEEEAEKWIQAALELARWSCDEGGLHSVLTGKRQVLRERRKGRMERKM